MMARCALATSCWRKTPRREEKERTMPDTRKVRECVEVRGRATLKLGPVICWRRDRNRAFT
jgi:hypothetical protein